MFFTGLDLSIKNSKLKQENQHLKDRIYLLDKEARDQANKNIILQSLINQKKS